MQRALDRRLAAIAAQLSPPEPPRDSADELMRWFTYREIDLAHLLFCAGDYETLEAAMTVLLERAPARSDARANIVALDHAERDQERPIRVHDPEGRPGCTYYLTCWRDPIDPDVWRVDGGQSFYRERYGNR